MTGNAERAALRLPPLEADPSDGQDPAALEAALRGAHQGMEVAIRETHGHMLRFVITTVTDTKPSAGRLYTASPGQTNRGGVAWYMKSGLNCFAPKGQATLVLATPAVKDFAARHPDGTTHYRVPSLENPGGLLARLRARAGR